MPNSQWPGWLTGNQFPRIEVTEVLSDRSMQRLSHWSLLSFKGGQENKSLSNFEKGFRQKLISLSYVTPRTTGNLSGGVLRGGGEGGNNPTQGRMEGKAQVGRLSMLREAIKS